MSCRHISLSFPTWLWGCWGRWEFLALVWHSQLCWEGLLLLAPGAAAPSLPTGQHVLCLSELSGPAQTQGAALQRGSGMGNDSGKDNDSGKEIKGLEIPASEMTACCCHCCVWVHGLVLLHIALVNCCATVPSQHTGSQHPSLSVYLFWLWGVFLKQLCYLFQSQQNPLSHLNLQSHN